VQQFVSAAALREGSLRDLGLSRRLEPVRRCRTIGKRDMVLNDALPKIEVDPRPTPSRRRRAG